MSKEKKLGKICAGYTTYKNLNIIDDSITDNLGINEFFFINCRIKNLKITDSTKLARLLFVNCQITNLAIRGSQIREMQFINCKIYDSTFIDSTLQGTVFSIRLSDKYNAFPGSGLFYRETFPDKCESRLENTKILFCEMNEMQINHTGISKLAIKHCWLEKLELSAAVSMKEVDLRGAFIFDSDLGSCRFNDIMFGKKKFVTEIFRLFQKLKHYRQFREGIGHQEKLNYDEKEKRERIAYYNIFKKMKKKRERDKKYNMPKAMFDWFSSTHVEKTSYEKADFQQEPYFYWYLKELEFYQIFEKRSPIISRALFVLSNYMRSFASFIVTIVFYISLFAGFYFFFGRFTIDITLTDLRILKFPLDIAFFEALAISVKNFLNIGISPFQENNTLTDVFIIIERIIGVLSLVFYGGKVSYNIYQNRNFPTKREPDEKLAAKSS